MLKYKVLYAILLLLAAGAFIYINSAASLLLLVLLVLLPFLIKLSLMDNVSKIKISCSMTEACVAGSEAKPLLVTIENTSALPMGSVELVVAFENHMFRTERSERINLCGSGKKQTFEIPVDSERCGRSSVVIKEVNCCDIFNIMRSRIDFKWRKRYTVYPRLPELQVHAQKQLTAEFGGRNYDRTRHGNDNSEVFQVRDYVAGDNLSAAHWKLSAKVDDIIIREWSRPNNFRLLLIFDLVARDAGGKEVSFATQAAIMGISSSISHELVRQGIGHNAAMVNCGSVLDMSIQQNNDSSVMLDEMMSIVVPKSNDNITEEILANGLQSKFSKLIYVGPEKNAGLLLGLSAYMDIAAIAVRDTGDMTYTRESGYTMYTLSAQAIAEKSHFLEL